MSVKCVGACSPYIEFADLCSPCIDIPYPDEAVDDAMAMASDILYFATGQQFPGTCVAQGTMVQTEFGSKPIEEVKVGERVWAWSSTGYNLREVLNVWDNGEREVLEINFWGRRLKVTPDHQVLTLRRGPSIERNIAGPWWTEWVEAKDLQRKDILVSLGGISEDGEEVHLQDGTRVDEDVAWLIGLCVGDGWIETDSIGIAGGGEPLVRATEILQRVWGLEARQRADYQWATRWFSRSLRRTWEALGLRKRSWEKEIPSLVYQLSTKLQRSFLEGYQAADGSWSEKKQLWQHAASSQRLVKQLRGLCIKLGDTVSNIYEHKRTGFIKSPDARYSDGMKNAKSLFEFTSSPVPKKTGQAITRFHKAREALGPDSRPMIIRSVTPVGVTRVYDIEVAEDHNFLADGLVVHNCREVVRPCASGFCGSYPVPQGLSHLTSDPCSCDDRPSCGCSPFRQIELGFHPISSIIEVKVCGPSNPSWPGTCVLPANLYHVDEFHWLVRDDDADDTNPGWPNCGYMGTTANADDLFTVDFSYGQPAPLMLKRAAAILACELIIGCDPDAFAEAECRLPRNVVSIARQGINVVMQSAFFTHVPGRPIQFGIPEVDMVIVTLNRHGLVAPNIIMSPDEDDVARRVGT